MRLNKPCLSRFSTLLKAPSQSLPSPAGFRWADLSSGPDERLLHLSSLLLFRVSTFISALQQATRSGRAFGPSSPSSNGPRISFQRRRCLRPPPSPPTYVGRPAVPQPAAATSASSFLFPAFQGFSSYSSTSPSSPSLSCVLKYPCAALAHGQGPQAGAKSV